jgi:hypothetical protein
MKGLVRRSIGSAVVIGAGLLFQPAQAGQGGPPTCSLATLRGVYMFAQSGYATAAANGPLVPGGVTGEDIFYGNGKFDSLATISLGGQIFQAVAAPGTYTINPNSDNPPSRCTGTVTVKMQPNAPDVHLNIFIQPDGDQFFTIQTDSTNVLAGIIQRVSP